MTKRWILALFMLLPSALAANAAPVIAIMPTPEHPIVETRDGANFVNFDMVVRNQSDLTLRVAKLEVSVYDASGALVQRRALNTDAFAPSIAVIGNQLMAPGQGLDVFNPFPEFDAQLPLDRLTFSFCLQREGNDAEREKNLHRLPDDCDYQAETSVKPRFYDTKTPLTLPLKGKIFVWEGHDFYAHHLRVPFGNPRVKALGIAANSNEFAADFIYTGKDGREYHGDPRNAGNWYSYGKPVFAPGAGTVVSTANGIPDNWFKDEKVTQIGHPQLPPGADPNDIGNFVLIDHGDGEFSLLVHMKPGSIRVKAGDHVAAGQQVGQIGFAGDSIFPHLHYSLMAGPKDTKDWGLPMVFTHFHRVYGAKTVEVARGPVNSGDFVESDAR